MKQFFMQGAIASAVCWFLSGCGGVEVVDHSSSSGSTGTGGHGSTTTDQNSGSGGATSSCVSSCETNWCGIDKGECGDVVDCGSCGDVMSCTEHNVCACAPLHEADAVAYICNDHVNGDPIAAAWCLMRGGCVASACGNDYLEKVPLSCLKSSFEAPDESGALTAVWCCVKSCSVDADCDDKNECTLNRCEHGSCYFTNDLSDPPCSGGNCQSGSCEP